MRLAVIERVMLGNVLSGEVGNFTTLKLIREATEALSFSESEHKLLGFTQDGPQLTWDSPAADELGDVDIDLGETVTGIIEKILTKLNDKSLLTDKHFSLYEKFVFNRESKPS